jgi:hypothetical protein
LEKNEDRDLKSGLKVIMTLNEDKIALGGGCFGVLKLCFRY